MKNKLIELAIKKGFNSKVFSNTEWKYSNKESIRYYLWLYELKLWIQNKIDKYLSIEFNTDMDEQLNDYENWQWNISGDYWNQDINQDDYSRTEQESLEFGLYECLNMIKD